MTSSPETFDTLWAYCSANNRAIPRDWMGLYKMLADKKQTPLAEPAVPLILAAWYVTPPFFKQLRFREHIQWAADHDQLDEIGAYLRALPEEGWYHFGELPTP